VLELPFSKKTWHGMIMDRWKQNLQRHKHLTLLVALVGMSLVQPLARGIVVGLVLFDVFLMLVLLGVFVVVFKRRHERQWAMALAVPAIVAKWAAYGLPADMQWAAIIVYHSLVLMFLAMAVAIILRGVFEDKTVESDHVIATVCGYLLAGVAWGNAYRIADLLVPGAFHMKPEFALQIDNDHTRSFLFNYFSLCTLTGTGYGDITPIWPGVASLTWMEAMFGQFYIAIVVTELIGLKLARTAEPPP
jgi:voltage-gated potassium channel